MRHLDDAPGLGAPISCGPSWIDGFPTFTDTMYALQIPLLRGTLDATVAFARAALAAITADRLDAIEVGNEPNFHPPQPPAPGYRPADYDRTFATCADALRGNLTLPAGRSFQAGAIASGAAGWTAGDVFGAGLADGAPLVRSFSMHYDQTWDDQPLAATLLDHAMTVRTTDDMCGSSVAFLREHLPRVAFVIGEVGSSRARGGPDDGRLDRVLGSAPWAVDWPMYTTSPVRNPEDHLPMRSSKNVS